MTPEQLKERLTNDHLKPGDDTSGDYENIYSEQQVKSLITDILQSFVREEHSTNGLEPYVAKTSVSWFEGVNYQIKSTNNLVKSYLEVLK